MRTWAFLLLIFSSLPLKAELSLVSFLSQKTNEIRNWESCQKASSSEVQALARRSKDCPVQTPAQKNRDTLDETAEQLFFDGSAESQLDSYECTLGQVQELLSDQGSSKIEQSRQRIAQDYALKIPLLSRLRKKLEAVDNELAEMERIQNAKPVADVYPDTTIDRERKKSLLKKQIELRSSLASTTSSLFQGGNHFLQERIEEEIKKKNFEAQKFISEFTKPSGPGSLNAILLKIQNETRREKATLLSKAEDPRATPRHFSLTDADKVHLYRDQNWIKNTSFPGLSCRLEGRYGLGRERFYTAAQVGTSAALTFIPGGLYLAVGRGLIAASAARTLGFAISAGIATQSIALTYERNCPQSDLRVSIKNSCQMPSENLAESLAANNCALDVALAALDIPFPELKSASLMASTIPTFKKLSVARPAVRAEKKIATNPQIEIWNAKAAGDLSGAKQAENSIKRIMGLGDMKVIGMVGEGKSGAFYVDFGDGIQGVWKPATGKVANGNAEMAAAKIDRQLGTDLVPVTVPRELNGIDGTVQLRITDLKKVESQAPEELAYFDYLIGNSDRHNGNFLKTEKDRLVAIDHGKSFEPDVASSPMKSLEEKMNALSKSPASATKNKKLYNETLQMASSLTPSKEVVEKLRKTSREEWKALLRNELNDRQIDQLVSRQKEILNQIDKAEKLFGNQIYRNP